MGNVPEHDLVSCRKWFFNQILLCKRDRRGNTWCSHAAFPGLGFPLGEICPGWALLSFGAELPARHLTPLPAAGAACSPALSGLIHLWGRLAGVPPLLLLPEADVSTRDQRKGKSVFPEVPWSFWLHRATSRGSSSLHTAPSLCCQMPLAIFRVFLERTWENK